MGCGTWWHKRGPQVVVGGGGGGECTAFTGIWPWGGLVPQSQAGEGEWVSWQPVTQAGPESLFSKSSESLKCPLPKEMLFLSFPFLCGWQMLLTPLPALQSNVAAPVLMEGLPWAPSDLLRGKPTSLSKCSHKMGLKLLRLNFYELDWGKL